MADPRWWWDSGAQSEIQHPFSYSNVYMSYIFSIQWVIQIPSKGKKPFESRFSDILKVRCWSVYQSNSKHLPAFSIIQFISGLVSYSQSHTWWGAERRKLRDKHSKHTLLTSVSESLISHWTQKGMCLPLNSHSKSPVPLLDHNILSRVRIRITEIRNSNRAMIVLCHIFPCRFPLLDTKLPDTAASSSFRFGTQRSACQIGGSV